MSSPRARPTSGPSPPSTCSGKAPSGGRSGRPAPTASWSRPSRSSSTSWTSPCTCRTPSRPPGSGGPTTWATRSRPRCSGWSPGSPRPRARPWPPGGTPSTSSARGPCGWAACRPSCTTGRPGGSRGPPIRAETATPSAGDGPAPSSRGASGDGGDHLDLDAQLRAGQGDDPDRRPGREVSGEVGAVDLVHRREVLHVRQVHGGLEHVLEVRARRLEDRPEIVHGVPGLGADVGGDFALGVGSDGAGGEEESPEPDAGGVGRQGGGAAHGEDRLAVHEAYFVRDLVEHFDLSASEATHEDEARGGPPTTPRGW